jgi:endonuclease/exonuclease/phosphatase family metal-dependent hydrolase
LRKYPITHADMVEFPPLSRLEKRLAGNHDGLLTSVDMPSGSLQALAVHFEVRDESTRVGCRDQVSSIAKEFGIPFLVLGDFNSTPSGYSGHQSDAEGRNAIDHLLRSGHFPAGQVPPPDSGYLTFPSAGPDRAIDWILATGDCELRNHRVISADLSDYLMVVADVVVNRHR